ncbi:MULTISPECIES: hypothetical protein [Bacillaceae]|uniref:hypothetical protein n=1 Tax=Bacillaceae TaxID=186817 RepID=UPI000E2ED0D8|nr:hypothetical protein [Bacillus sp. HNG]RFB09326.1 hypothetical protein DZB84_24425 [Bacillus sp. HNG]
MSALLSKVEEFANEHYAGHFTVIKTNKNWHACFGVLDEKEEIKYIHSGKSFEDVLQKLLNEPLDSSGVRVGEDNFDFHGFEDVYAIKINDKHWFPDYYHPEKEHVLVFTTEKKAFKEVELIKKRPKYSELDLKVVRVEEETLIHFKKGIHRQTIRELQ